MENKFFIPAATFLSGISVWFVLFIAYLVSDAVQGWAPWIAIAVCLLVAGLLFFSAMSCRKAGGPKIGAIVRASVLAVFAVLTIWKIGMIAAAILFVAAVAVVISGLGADSEIPSAAD